MKIVIKEGEIKMRDYLIEMIGWIVGLISLDFIIIVKLTDEAFSGFIESIKI